MQKTIFRKPKKAHLAFGLALLANILWASSFLGSKYTLLEWGPMTASFLRFLVASIVLGTILPLMGETIRLPRKTEVLGISLIGVIQFGFLYPLQLTGLTHISTSLSAAIMLLSPLFVVILGKFLLKEALSQRKLVAITLGIVGGLILLVSGFFVKGSFFAGFLITLLSAICLGLSVVLTRRYAKKMSVAHLSFWSMLVGALTLLPMALYEHGVSDATLSLASVNSKAIFSLLYLSVVCTAFTFYIWNKALAMVPAKHLASTMHVKTPVAIFIGGYIAGEALSHSLLLGSALIIYAAYLSQSDKKKKVLIQKEVEEKQEKYKGVGHATAI